TNGSKAVDLHFKDFCTSVDNPEELDDILPAMAEAPSKENMDRAFAGSEFVKKHHCWERRLEQMAGDIGL
ncbi:MAG: hypothetical protein J6P70_03445, partial [Ruminobacter sp.]|nr:hypothetical protein [Ruminobacter sp.]